MENNLEDIKDEHTVLIDRLILILNNYQKYMKSHIKDWEPTKCRELDLVNREIDDLIDSFFSLVEE